MFVNHRQGVEILAKLDAIIMQNGVIMSATDKLTQDVAALTDAVGEIIGALGAEVAALKQANANLGNDPVVAAATTNIEGLTAKIRDALASTSSTAATAAATTGEGASPSTGTEAASSDASGAAASTDSTDAGEGSAQGSSK